MNNLLRLSTLYMKFYPYASHAGPEGLVISNQGCTTVIVRNKLTYYGKEIFLSDIVETIRWRKFAFQ